MSSKLSAFNGCDLIGDFVGEGFGYPVQQVNLIVEIVVESALRYIRYFSNFARCRSLVSLLAEYGGCRFQDLLLAGGNSSFAPIFLAEGYSSVLRHLKMRISSIIECIRSILPRMTQCVKYYSLHPLERLFRR